MENCGRLWTESASGWTTVVCANQDVAAPKRQAGVGWEYKSSARAAARWAAAAARAAALAVDDDDDDNDDDDDDRHGHNHAARSRHMFSPSFKAARLSPCPCVAHHMDPRRPCSPAAAGLRTADPPAQVSFLPAAP